MSNFVKQTRRSRWDGAAAKTCLAFTLLSGGSVVPVIPSYNNAVHAASYDAAFVQTITDRYNTIESKFTNQYKEDQRKITKEYEALRDSFAKDQHTLEQLLEEDLSYLVSTLEADYKELQSLYRDDRSFTQKLLEYERAINPNYATGPLWAYNKESNKSYSTSLHWRFARDINPEYATSPMWKYRNHQNPAYSTSPMWSYANTMNPSYSTGLLWKLRNEANTSYATGTMWKYTTGRVNKTNTQTAMDKLFQQAELDLQTARNKAVTTLKETHSQTSTGLKQLRDDTVDKLLLQRDKSLDTIMGIRERHFGSRLTIRPLQISFDDIKVTIDGILQRFDQPPVIINGNTLVPMRAIFERLGAEITWNDKERSVTAVKGTTTIYLKIDSTTARIGDRETTLNVHPQLIQSTTMVPLRFVGEALGADVGWDNTSRTVVIQTKD